MLGSMFFTAVSFTMHTIAMPMSIFCMYCIPTPANMINARRKRIENKSDGPERRDIIIKFFKIYKKFLVQYLYFAKLRSTNSISGDTFGVFIVIYIYILSALKEKKILLRCIKKNIMKNKIIYMFYFKMPTKHFCVYKI